MSLTNFSQTMLQQSNRETNEALKDPFPKPINFLKLKFHELTLSAISLSSFEKGPSVSSGGEYFLQEDAVVLSARGASARKLSPKLGKGSLASQGRRSQKICCSLRLGMSSIRSELKLSGVLWTPIQYGCRGQLLLSCQQKDKEVNRSPRNDKRAYLEDNAACAERSGAEQAAEKKKLNK